MPSWKKVMKRGKELRLSSFIRLEEAENLQRKLKVKKQKKIRRVREKRSRHQRKLQ